MRRFWLAGLFLVLGAPLAAQVGPGPERLREQVMVRFMNNFRNQAGLTDEQFASFQSAARTSWEARAQLQRREREILQALERQMRPGIAADADSVSALIEAAIQVQTDLVTQARADQVAYAEFLSPVQRGQLVLAWVRFERQVEEIVRQRLNQNRRNQQR
jgi:hypothetical protein